MAPDAPATPDPGSGAGEPTPEVYGNIDPKVLLGKHYQQTLNARWQDALIALNQWEKADPRSYQRTFTIQLLNITDQEGNYKGTVIQVNFNYNSRGVPESVRDNMRGLGVVVSMSSKAWGNGHAEAGDASEIADEGFMLKKFGGDIGGVPAFITQHSICAECSNYARFFTGESSGTEPGSYGYVHTATGGEAIFDQRIMVKLKDPGVTPFGRIVDFVSGFPIYPGCGFSGILCDEAGGRGNG
jgi:hypothetical protein